MAFQTGSFSSAADLIATIKTFASANGWLVSGDVIYRGSVYTALTIEAVTDDMTSERIRVQGGTGESAGVLTGASSGSAYCLGGIYTGTSSTFDFAFPATYYLFNYASPDTIICIARSNEGLYFNWLTFGVLTKYGSYTGGEFFGATHGRPGKLARPSMQPKWHANNSTGRGTMAPFWDMTETAYYLPNTYVRSDLGAEAWIGENGPGNTVDVNLCAYSLITRTPNAWNGQAAMAPFWVRAKRPDGFYSLLGLFEHARNIRVTNYEATDIITLGSDRYMTFPFFRKSVVYPDGALYTGGTSGLYVSGTLGWAIAYDGP